MLPQSRSDQGLIKVQTTTLNQHGFAVLVLIGNLIVPRRRQAVPHLSISHSRKARI